MGETQSSPKRLRSRQCMFVLYPESQETAIKYAQENFPCAWALHDKDVHTEKAYQAYIEKNGEPPEWRPGDLKKPHIHFVCSFPNARYFSGIARDLGVPVNTIRKPPDHYAPVSCLLGMSASQSSALMPLHSLIPLVLYKCCR